MKQCPQEMLNGITTRSPRRDVRDVGADLLDDPHRLVAEDVALAHERAEHLVQVQVGAADPGRRDPDDRVGRLLDRRVGDRVDPDVALAVPHHCLHELPPPSCLTLRLPAPDPWKRVRAIACTRAARRPGRRRRARPDHRPHQRGAGPDRTLLTTIDRTSTSCEVLANLDGTLISRYECIESALPSSPPRTGDHPCPDPARSDCSPARAQPCWAAPSSRSRRHHQHRQPTST